MANRTQFKPLPFVEALKVAKARKVALPDDYYGERITRARSMAFTVTGLAKVDQIQGVLDKLNKIQKQGGGLRDFQQAVKAGTVNLDLPKWRIELIYRNNIQNNYNAGRWLRHQENKAARPYLKYVAVNDGRTRPAHAAMNGHVAAIDDPWWDSHATPNGFNCRCISVSVTSKEAERGGLKPAPNAEPDKGWDYNPGKDYMAGLKQAAKEKRKKVHPRLVKVVDKAVDTEIKPVSHALEPLGYKKAVKHVLSVIDQVHDDGKLPVIPINRTTSKSSFFSRKGYRPIEIGMSTHQADIRELALVHEIGHFIDFGALNGASIEGGMEEVIVAIRSTDLVKRINERLLKTKIDDYKTHYKYLLRPQELWARSYAQWLTIRSGDGILNDQLDFMLTEYKLMQWSSEEFKPIYQAINQFMKNKGWLK